MRENKQKWLYGAAGLITGVLIMVLAGTLMGKGDDGSMFQGYLTLPRPAAVSPAPKRVLPISKKPVDKPDPQSAISRAYLIKLIVVASGVPINTTGAPHFTDVNSQEWQYEYVETAYNAGWIQPYQDGSFKPGEMISRAEGAKFFHKAFLEPPAVAVTPANDPNCEYPDVISEAWYHNFVNHMCHAQFLDVAPGSNFDPSNYLTLGTAEKWIANVGNFI